MKTLLSLTLAGAMVAATGAAAAADIGVSIGINQPGVYGRVDIGRFPQPALVYPEPVLIAPPRVVVQRQPIYLYVPPAHQRDWRRYCGRYNACGQPVYFVQEQWVRERYVHEHPGWRDRRDWRDRHDGRDGRDWRDDHRGPGRDHGPDRGDHGRRGRDGG